MRSVRWYLVVLLSLLVESLQGQTHTILRPTLRQQLDSIIDVSLSDLPLAGVSVAVLRGRDTLIWTAKGYSDLENRVPATPSTVYRIGSLTKQFTAAAILQLVDRGKIRLDDDVSKFVPEYSTKEKRVTIRQLLNHTSGIRDFNDLGDAFSRTLAVDLPQKDVLALVRDQPFDFEPGSRWRYNNTGYYLLGVILERVTGKPYVEYISEEVLRPAGLTATTYCGGWALIPHRAHGYDAVGIDFLNAQYLSLNLVSAAGLCSTVGDVVTWARALQTGRVVSQQSYRLMTTPVGPAAAVKPPYGFGVWVIEVANRRYITHHGQMAGFNARLSMVPSESLTIAVLTNTSGLGASLLGGRLSSVLLDIPPPKVEKASKMRWPRGRALTRSELLPYIGRYKVHAAAEDSSALPGLLTLQIFDENGRLTAYLTGDPPEALIPLGGHRFVATARSDKHFLFEVRKDQAIHVTYTGPDGVYEGARVPDP